jgi:hypothetical protein
MLKSIIRQKAVLGQHLNGYNAVRTRKNAKKTRLKQNVFKLNLLTIF